ncbi:MAG: PEP-CTERM sorting domain-containing protein, partial [Verrucomicrobia bacterium]|nr:PEP-CTERM sorting domain-containing protein [Verrucomicrobiota bacterium]
LIFSNTTDIPLFRSHFGTVLLENGAIMIIASNAAVAGGFIMSATAGDNSALILKAGSVMSNGASGLVIGDVGRATASIETGATVNTTILAVGRGVSGAGAVYQSGGTVIGNINPGGNWVLGQVANSYGYYNLSGGSITMLATNQRFQVGLAGVGQFDMSGGSFTMTSQHFSVGAGGPGVFNVSGGGFTQGFAGASTRLIVADAANFPGVLNVSGTAQLTLLGGLRVAWNNSATGIVNLLGGTLSTASLQGRGDAGAGVGANPVFNFNGGVLQALANDTNWFGGASSVGGFNKVYVRENGATIDVQGFNVTVQAGLVAPTGLGIGSIPVAYGGQGYLGPPAVILLGGGGSNATAYAQIDPVTGSVTNIVVTNPGEGYTSAPIIQLVGDSPSFIAVAGAPTLAANLSGGLTVTGVGGKLAIAGNSTYTGPTVLGAGATLQVGAGGPSGTLDNGLIFGSGTFTNDGWLIYARSDTNTAGNNVTGTGGLGVLGTGSGWLNLGGTNDFSGGMFVTNGTLVFLHDQALPALGTITLGCGAVGFVTNNLQANLLPRIANSSTGAIVLLSGQQGESLDYTALGGFPDLGIAAGADMTYTGTYTPYQAGTLGAMTNYFRLGAEWDVTLTWTNVISDTFNGGNLSELSVNRCGPPFAGTVVLADTNTHSLGTFLGGGTLVISNDFALGQIPGAAATNLTFLNKATFRFGDNINLAANRSIAILTSTGFFDSLGNTSVIPGTIAGDGSLHKTGSGTLILNGGADSLQFLTVGQGTLVLSSMVMTVTGVFADGVTIVGQASNNNNALLVVGGGASLIHSGITTNALTVGNYGSGNSLLVTNGGYVQVGQTGGVHGLWVGNQNGSSNNTVTVTGAGSLMRVDGRIEMGFRSSNNTMQILDGGSVTNQSFVIVGDAFGANDNLLLVSGAGSLLSNATQGILVGNSGTGNRMIASNGARVVTLGQLIPGTAAAGSNNSIVVTDPGTFVLVGNNLQVGQSSSGNVMRILNGATVVLSNTTTSTIVGNNFGANSNLLVVDGIGSTLLNSNQVIVGNVTGALFNTMVVSGGGLAVTRQGVFVGQNGTTLPNVTGAGANSNLLYVTGAGTIMTNNVFAADTRAGNGGSFNTMVINSNAAMFTRNFYVGVNNNANSNLLVVSDGGALWANATPLTNATDSTRFAVGLRGVGNGAIVTNGGHIYVTRGSDAATGVGASDLAGNGHSPTGNWMLVSGPGSTFSNAGLFTVGRSGSGNWLLVNNGAGFTNMGTFTIGERANSPAGPLSNFANNVTITDPGTVFFGGSNLVVGNNNLSNTLTIANGATLITLGGGPTPGSYIGSNAGVDLSGGHNNSVLVTGAGTLWTNRASLEVGQNGSFNSLIISNGAALITGTGGLNRLRIGNGAASSNNWMLVTSSGSVVTSQVAVIVGESGFNNTLTVTNGGTMYANNSLAIGNNTTGSNNTLLVSGLGAVLNTLGPVSVGNTGLFNQLVVAGGGTMTNAGDLTVGASALGRSNTVRVTDTGSLLYAAANVSVGLSTSVVAGNQMVLESGGKADVRGNLTVSTNSVLNNTLLGVLYLGGNLSVRSTNYAQTDLSGKTVFNGGAGAVTQLVEVLSAYTSAMSTTNFFFGRFEVGDAVANSNAAVRLVNQFANTAGIVSEVLAVNSLIVAVSNSVLDLNNLGVFANSLVNSGTVQQVALGGSARVDLVSTFTNQGTVSVANGSFLQFSNSFINAGNGLVRLEGGVLTNFVTASVLTNNGIIGGVGTVTPVIGNEPLGRIAATGGVLTVVSGFTNSGAGQVNNGLLAALGGGSELRIAQSFTNAGSIWVNNVGATVSLTNDVSSLNLVNAAAGLIQGQGTINAFVANSGQVSNSTGGALTFNLAFLNQAGGTVLSRDGGSTVVFNGAVTNAAGGTLKSSNGGVLVFNGVLNNSGTLATDPSTTIVNGTLILGASGVITLPTTNDVLVLRGDFINNSTNNMAFDTRNGRMDVGGVSAAVTNKFELAGVNGGGFNANNFALGILNVTNPVEFVDEFNNVTGAPSAASNQVLYVDVLRLFTGATMDINTLTIYVGLKFIDENTGTTYTVGTFNSGNNPDPTHIFFGAGGQIVIIPEPSTGALLALGVSALAGWRRRKSRICRKETEMQR